MGKGVTELVEDFKELHPRAYARIYNQALEDFVEKCEKATFYQFGQHYVDMRDIREFKKELSK